MNTLPVESPSLDTLNSPNSRAAIAKRIALGKVSWRNTLIVLVGRSALMIVSQALVAAIYLLRSHPSPWSAAAPWWSVYATLVDLGCLALMLKFTRIEGIHLRDLVGKTHLRGGHDIWLGLACLAVGFVFFGLVAQVASRIVLGTVQPNPYPGLLSARVLPWWGTFYSLLFWIIWSPTEEMTYQGFALARIEALCGRTWPAVLLVALWWALQHSFIPFIVEWRYIVWRFFFFLPGVLAFLLIYLRLRRLPPLILAHWSLDIMASFFTLKF
jgi:hypothetical protein